MASALKFRVGEHISSRDDLTGTQMTAYFSRLRRAQAGCLAVSQGVAVQPDWRGTRDRLCEILKTDREGPPGPSAPEDWDPRTDRQYDRWKAVFEVFPAQGLREPLDSRINIFLVSLTSFSPRDIAAMRPVRVARLRGYCERLIGATRQFHAYWELLQPLILANSRTGRRSPSRWETSDIGVVELAGAIRQADDRFRITLQTNAASPR